VGVAEALANGAKACMITLSREPVARGASRRGVTDAAITRGRW